MFFFIFLLWDSVCFAHGRNSYQEFLFVTFVYIFFSIPTRNGKKKMKTIPKHTSIGVSKMHERNAFRPFVISILYEKKKKTIRIVCMRKMVRRDIPFVSWRRLYSFSLLYKLLLFLPTRQFLLSFGSGTLSFGEKNEEEEKIEKKKKKSSLRFFFVWKSNRVEYISTVSV